MEITTKPEKTYKRDKHAVEQSLPAELPPLVRQIGNTPLIELRHVTRHLPSTVSVFAKAEFMNPGGSVKDRPALAMIVDGLRTGKLHAGKVLLDATSGNTGIAYAMIGAALGIRVKLAMPANASKERKLIMQAYGADIVLTDALEGTDGSQRYARQMAAEHPDQYFYPDQYNNNANWKAHFEGTGAEIIEQTKGTVTHFVTGLGTSGTFTGVSRRLKRYDPAIQCWSVQPDSPMHGIEGMKHMETAIVPGIYNPSTADASLRIASEDAVAMTRRLASEEGLLVGVSSGANVQCALRVAEQIERGVVVTVLCDTGMRYLSDSFWNQD